MLAGPVDLAAALGVVSQPWSLVQCNTVFEYILPQLRASLVAQLVKNPPAMWKIWVRSLGWEDALEKGKATYSSILA